MYLHCLIHHPFMFLCCIDAELITHFVISITCLCLLCIAFSCLQVLRVKGCHATFSNSLHSSSAASLTTCATNQVLSTPALCRCMLWLATEDPTSEEMERCVLTVDCLSVHKRRLAGQDK
jgi:hypothetical protein